MKNIVKKIIGIIFIISGIVLLVLSESEFIDRLSIRKEVTNKCSFVKSTFVDSKYNGKLVATNGYLILNDDLVDPLFNVSIRTSKLERVVEMYQYNEVMEDEETYSYETNWYSKIIDSSKFKNNEYVNPSSIKYESKKFYNDTYLGAFKLTNEQIDDLGVKSRYLDLDENYAKENNLNISNEYYTTSKDIDLPEVGDIRISFRYNDSSSISVLAMQKDNSFDNYIYGKENINKVYDEKLSKEEIIDKTYDIDLFSNITCTIFSYILCLIGFIILSLNIINSFTICILCISIMYFRYNFIVSLILFVCLLILLFIQYKFIYKKSKSVI